MNPPSGVLSVNRTWRGRSSHSSPRTTMADGPAGGRVLQGLDGEDHVVGDRRAVALRASARRSTVHVLPDASTDHRSARSGTSVPPGPLRTSPRRAARLGRDLPGSWRSAGRRTRVRRPRPRRTVGPRNQGCPRSAMRSRSTAPRRAGWRGDADECGEDRKKGDERPDDDGVGPGHEAPGDGHGRSRGATSGACRGRQDVRRKGEDDEQDEQSTIVNCHNRRSTSRRLR